MEVIPKRKADIILVNYKILIIEDDCVISREMKTGLSAWGYEVEAVEDFNNIMGTFIQFNPQIILLDISLPFYNGYYWCSQIRKVSQIPIIFISSNNDNMNVIMAVNMGGDDFIAKPFDQEILYAKVQAMLRRTYSFTSQTNLLECRGVILNLSNASLEVNGKKIELTKNEFRILQALFENKGKTVTREVLMTHLWDSDCFIDDNTLAVNLTRLRKKLEEASLKDFITTQKGLGYMLEES